MEEAVSTPVGEVRDSLAEAREMVEKVAKDFFREELVDDPGITTSMVVLEGVLVRME